MVAHVLEDLLATAEDWPTDHHAVGVTTADATVATHGEVDGVIGFASVTKPVFAYGFLVAVQDGLVHLDEPAGPEGATVRHLLAHASGVGPDESSPTSRVEQRRIYSNHGFDLLGDLLADRTGEPVALHLEHELFAPLGMDDTTLDGSPAHAMSGTVTDLLAFGRELLDPSLLDDELWTELAIPQFPDLDGILPGYGRQSPNPWGLGFEVRGTKSPHWTGPDQDPATFGHFGQTGSFLWVDRDLGHAAACLTGTTFGEWAVEAWPPFNQSLHDALREARS